MTAFRKYKTALIAITVAFSAACREADTRQVDICIYGGTSAGVIAAYTASKAGKSVLLVEPGRRLGGMTSGGLGYTDIGNKFVVTGLARDFYRRVGTHYGRLEQWVFEPSVAENIFEDYISRGNVNVLRNHRITSAQVKGRRINSIVVENSESPSSESDISIHAREFIDCSYEGDLMARAGVSYTVGREDNSTYGETYNGSQVMRGHQFWDPIDPYVVPGDSTSGLIFGINQDPVAPAGTGDKKIQAYNYRVCLTNDTTNMIPVTKPENYHPEWYELVLRLHEVSPRKSVYDYFIWSMMPNSKTDINNGGGISTDFIGQNHEYPEASYERREEIRRMHEDYTKGLFFFLGNDPRVPEHMRRQMRSWGYPKDEYTENGNWSPQLYVREARRMIGQTVMTEHHCTGRAVAPDYVAWAAYTMDSHNCDRHVIDGAVKNEGNVEIGGFPPYPISFGAIVPGREEIENLLVPVCLSASHIAYGSIRMEPVFMVLAQAAAVAAVIADDAGIPVQDVDAAEIRTTMDTNPLADGSIPEIVIDDNSPDVALSGEWTAADDPVRAYGLDYRLSTKAGDSALFTPRGISPGAYRIYAYRPKLEKDSGHHSIDVEVFDGLTTHRSSVENISGEVLGQTFGEWVEAGVYNLTPEASVRLIAPAAGLPLDALLFLPLR